MDILDTLSDLGHNHRLARVAYRGAGQAAASPRVVEPYAIEGAGHDRVLRCRQVEPAAPGPDAWKRLRLDRIAAVADAGHTFVPQAAVTLDHARAHHPFSDAQRIAPEPGEEYAQYVLSCLLDGRLSEAEVHGAAQVAAELDDDRRRAIHARVYAAALNEAAMDGAVSGPEADYLRRLHGFLQTLGWAPGSGV